MIALPRRVLVSLSVLVTAGIAAALGIYASSSRTTDTYTRLDDGVLIKLSQPAPNGASRVKLQAVTDHIIHVTAGTDDSLATTPSLMVVPEKRNPQWTLTEAGDQLILTTPALKATVSRTTGDIVFADLSGHTLLKEVTHAGRLFSPQRVSGESSRPVQQTFELQGDEAFYGLGQHQEGIFNYRGNQVNLLQQNSDVAVPFMISSRNYGILWDNYSITRFGDCRPFQPLSTLHLFDVDGKPGGLTATYTSSKQPAQVRVQRTENKIDYGYLQSLQQLPSGFSLQNGLVRYEGSMASSFTGQHTFLMNSGGYIKVWFDGKLVADKWRQCWNPAPTSWKMDLVKDQKIPVVVEWIPDGGESFLSLQWQSPIPAKDQNTFSFSSEAGDHINYYFVSGKNMDEVIAGYRTLTGRSPIVPKWAMGFWQSRERYNTQEELLSVVKEFRRRQIPLDNIVLDWFYWKKDQWGSHEFDTSRFPDADAMIRDLHDQYHTQFMISVWPKFYTGTKHYDLFNSRGWLYKQNVLNQQKDWVGYVSTFYDAFNPQARELFWQLMNEKLYRKGVDAWWMDATEPDILSNTSIEERKKLNGPTAIGSATRYFNAFALENAKGVYEGQRKTNPDKRVFILTRSAYAGSQRYAAATWSGDIGARWEDLKNQVPAGLNFALSGIPYWTTDIGGFATEKRYQDAKGKDLDEWREQMARWYQFGAFCPLFRSHGQYPYREIFHAAPEDHPAYKSILYYNRLRYRLMPYIYTLAGQTWHNNYTMMRALVMDFAHDTAVRNIGDQYMFGPSLLVNPVFSYGATNRMVYLPAGTGWYDLYSGNYYTGAQHLQVAAPYERIPLFVKEGAIIPVGPELQYTGEKQPDPITLFVYTGRDGQFTLYEDENTNYNYEKGRFATIPFSYSEKSRTLTIGQRKGAFDGMLQERTFHIVFMNKKQPKAFDPDDKSGQTIRYKGMPVTISMK